MLVGKGKKSFADAKPSESMKAGGLFGLVVFGWSLVVWLPRRLTGAPWVAGGSGLQCCMKHRWMMTPADPPSITSQGESGGPGA